jgi:type II secretory pathway predicted ATPase ExeA
MFLNCYGLREQPFGVTPDPRYLFQTAVHREALASLIYGIESQMGFTSLIAQPGMGKTTLLYCLLKRYRETARTAFVFETQCSSRELLQHVFAELEIDVGSLDLVTAHGRFKEFLIAQARARRQVLLIFDEAQNLGNPVLETIRLLSNFETSQGKLLHIVLAGQPPLANKLACPELRQLQQRISIFARLKPFSSQDTQAYIEHRLKVAGYTGPPLFTPEAYQLLAAGSHGIPREINRMCFAALSLGCALKRQILDANIVREVGADLELDSSTEDMPELNQTSKRLSPAGRRITSQLQQSSVEFSWALGNGGTTESIPSFADSNQQRPFHNRDSRASIAEMQEAAGPQPAPTPSIQGKNNGHRSEPAEVSAEVKAPAPDGICPKPQSTKAGAPTPSSLGTMRESMVTRLNLAKPPDFTPSARTGAAAGKKSENQLSAKGYEWLGWWEPSMLLPFVIVLLLFLLLHYKGLLAAAVFASR